MASRDDEKKRRPSSKRVQFRYQAPEAREVAVAGDFNDWNASGYPLKRESDGAWKRALTLPPGRYEYRFVVDGEWRDDPACEHKIPNPFGGNNSIVEVG